MTQAKKRGRQIRRSLSKSLEHSWSRTALEVLRERYFLRDEEDRVTEDPESLFWRVSRAIAAVEPAGKRGYWSERFFSLMFSGRFLPNSPTLMNAGKPGGQLSACYVLPVEDSLEGIFQSLKESALIHQSGGGTGFSFSRVRGRGSVVRSTHGSASGPVSFIRIFDSATETVKQGGVRRGANMAVLQVDHPDILEFVRLKKDFRQATNFNISVGISDEFMRALARGSSYQLRDPRDQRVISEVSAADLFGEIVESAWVSGDPGLIFLDRMNFFNPTPEIGLFEATNPCGEQPLLPHESCNLGSLNLSRFVNRGEFDWASLSQAVETAVRFLDNVIDANFYPIQACRKMTLKTRKIGLGVMGFADLLLKLGLPYDSAGGRDWGERVMSFVDRRAKEVSMRLAQERGSFPSFRRSLWARLGYPAMRNATVSTVAPTGTLSLLAGCSSGIEPVFAARFERHILDGRVFEEVHPALQEVLDECGYAGGLSEDKLKEILKGAWSPARDVSVEGHVRMQAVFQRHSDSAVSKTINLPQRATPEDVRRAYLMAYDLGCKGITVYRDQSRPSQVLQAESENCSVCAD